MKKTIVFPILFLLLGLIASAQGTFTGIDFYADEVSGHEGGGFRSIYMTQNDTITFKLSNTVEIDGHYYNSGGDDQCDFLLVFVLDQVWISDCEGNRYRSVRRCGRANCNLIHLECILPDQSEHKDTMMLNGLNLGGR